MQIIVNNLMCHYERYGSPDAPTVVIIHGWADSSASWAPVARILERDFQVIVPDLPGFGRSQQPPVPWGLDEYAAHLASLLAKIGARPYVIVGHSNGGAIAIRGLATSALSADRLVLIASAGIRSEGSLRKRSLAIVTKIGKIATWLLPGKAKSSLRRKLYQTVGSDLLVAPHMQETFRRVVGTDIQADAADLHTPTLLLYGTTDDQTPVRYGELLHSLIVGSSLQTLPDAGHLIHIDSPDTTAQAIAGFAR